MNRILSFIVTKRYYLLAILILSIILIVRQVLLSNPTPVLTYTVKQESLVDTVQVSGNYTTASQTQVMSPTKGIITNLYTDSNSQVSKGAPLFHVESTATIDQKQAAYATYESAVAAEKTSEQNKLGLQSQLEQDRQSVISASSAVTTMENNINVSQPNPATKLPYTQNDKDAINSALTSAHETFTEDETKYTQANVAIGATQAQVTAAKQLYNETQDSTVTSPIGGTIVNLLKNTGDDISDTSQPVLIVANLQDPSITATVDEVYATRVSTGQKATIFFDALPRQTFTGYVGNIDTVGTNTQGVITYNARINFDSIPAAVKPNMTAIITIETLRKDTILDVPNSAILNKDGKFYVESANNTLIPVTIGIQGLTKTEITDGLSAGTVILANAK